MCIRDSAPSVRSIYGLFPGFFTGHHSGWHSHSSGWYSKNGHIIFPFFTSNTVQKRCSLTPYHSCGFSGFSIFKQFISPSSFHLLIFIIRDSQAPASVFARIFENKKTQVILVVVASPIRGNLCSLVRCSNCCVLGALFRFPSFVLICRNFPYSALTRHFLGATWAELEQAPKSAQKENRLGCHKRLT